MEHIGIDVHKKESQLCSITEVGEVVERRIRTECGRFAEVLGGRGKAKVLLEASTESEWIAQAIEGLGHKAVVADPNFAPMYGSRTRRVKTDKRDARALPDACVAGTYRKAHRASAAKQVMIEGHTDSVGSNEMNLGLSKRRAKAVEKYLIAKGIAAARLRSEGYGYHRPVAPNDTVLNRARNRRTEFKLTEEIVTPPKEKPAPKKGASPPPEQPIGKPAPAQKPVAPPVKKPMPSREPAPKK